LVRWRRSGESARAFCIAAGLREPSFYAWRRELARRDAAVREATRASGRESSRASTPPLFVPVEVTSLACNAALELVLTGGTVLRIPPGCDAATLTTVLAVLESRPC
jgi:hypothetical protein